MIPHLLLLLRTAFYANHQTAISVLFPSPFPFLNFLFHCALSTHVSYVILYVFKVIFSSTVSRSKGLLLIPISAVARISMWCRKVNVRNTNTLFRERFTPYINTDSINSLLLLQLRSASFALTWKWKLYCFPVYFLCKMSMTE